MAWCVRQARLRDDFPSTFITSSDTASRGILARCVHAAAGDAGVGRQRSAPAWSWASSASNDALSALRMVLRRRVCGMEPESTPGFAHMPGIGSARGSWRRASDNLEAMPPSVAPSYRRIALQPACG